MKFGLLYPSSFDISEIESALMAEGIGATAIASPNDVTAGGNATVLIIDPATRSQYGTASIRKFVEEGGAVVVLGAPDERQFPEILPDNLVSGFVATRGDADAFARHSSRIPRSRSPPRPGTRPHGGRDPNEGVAGTDAYRHGPQHRTQLQHAARPDPLSGAADHRL